MTTGRVLLDQGVHLVHLLSLLGEIKWTISNALTRTVTLSLTHASLVSIPVQTSLRQTRIASIRERKCRFLLQHVCRRLDTLAAGLLVQVAALALSVRIHLAAGRCGKEREAGTEITRV